MSRAQGELLSDHLRSTYTRPAIDNATRLLGRVQDPLLRSLVLALKRDGVSGSCMLRSAQVPSVFPQHGFPPRLGTDSELSITSR